MAPEETPSSQQKPNRGVPGSRAAELSQLNSPGEECTSKLPTGLCPWPWPSSSRPRSLGLLLGRPRPCAPPFPTAPPPFRPRSASVPDDPSPGRPPSPPPRAGAASRASGVAESASGRRCGGDGTRRDRAGGHGESGPRRRAHRLEPAPDAGAMDRAPAEQVRECPGCSRPPGGPGRLGWEARGSGPGPVCAPRRQALLLQRSGMYSFYEATTVAFPRCFPS